MILSVGEKTINWVDTSGSLRLTPITKSYADKHGAFVFMRNGKPHVLSGKTMYVYDGDSIHELQESGARIATARSLNGGVYIDSKTVSEDKYVFTVSLASGFHTLTITFIGDTWSSDFSSVGIVRRCYYDCERFWHMREKSNKIQYICDDPTRNFSTPQCDEFVHILDVNRGMFLLGKYKKESHYDRVSFEVISSSTPGVAWEYTMPDGALINRVKFISNNVIVLVLRAYSYKIVDYCRFINMADGTEYELCFCG